MAIRYIFISLQKTYNYEAPYIIFQCLINGKHYYYECSKDYQSSSD